MLQRMAPRNSLPDPHGPLSVKIQPSVIEEVNMHVQSIQRSEDNISRNFWSAGKSLTLLGIPYILVDMITTNRSFNTELHPL